MGYLASSLSTWSLLAPAFCNTAVLSGSSRLLPGCCDDVSALESLQRLRSMLRHLLPSRVEICRHGFGPHSRAFRFGAVGLGSVLWPVRWSVLAGGGAAPSAAPRVPSYDVAAVQTALGRYLAAYRTYGAAWAQVDPLGLSIRRYDPELSLASHPVLADRGVRAGTLLTVVRGALSPASDRGAAEEGGELVGVVDSALRFGLVGDASVDAFLATVRHVYAGVDRALRCMHVPDPEARRWLLAQWEQQFGPRARALPASIRRRLGRRLAKGEVFNQFMARVMPVVKRYSAEGTDAWIAGLEAALLVGQTLGATHAVLGMPHRGRLNVLTELLGLAPQVIFGKARGGSEFPLPTRALGDVLSHLSVTADLQVHPSPQPDDDHEDRGEAGPEFPTTPQWFPSSGASPAPHGIRVSLLPNPSALETVDPVVLGNAWGKQDWLARCADPPTYATAPLTAQQCAEREERSIAAHHAAQKRVLPVLVHGDGAIAGQGVVQETQEMALLSGFTVGGTVHLVVDNSLGFTTDSRRSRSSLFASDILMLTGAPVIHVSSDAPEAIVRGAQLVTAFRQRFARDAVLHIHGYRRFGHNEIDAAAITHPGMYAQIANHPTVASRYGGLLHEAGVWPAARQQAFRKRAEASLERALAAVRASESPSSASPADTPLPSPSSASVAESAAKSPETWSQQLQASWQAAEAREARPASSAPALPWLAPTSLWGEYCQPSPGLGRGPAEARDPDTAVLPSAFADALEASVALPATFELPVPVARRPVAARQKLAAQLRAWAAPGASLRDPQASPGDPLPASLYVDWSSAEACAFATLLRSGYSVRISGQDVLRGTFSQRFASFVNQKPWNSDVFGEAGPVPTPSSAQQAAWLHHAYGAAADAGPRGLQASLSPAIGAYQELVPLQHLLPGADSGGDVRPPGAYTPVSSHLSEYGVLGFEAGVSWARPDTLTLCEFQFGDFHIGAQPIIDTIIATGESRWLRQSGLVLLLPHGLDGAGPDHSSGRIERWLQLCDEPPGPPTARSPGTPSSNMVIAHPTTPANLFHLLRRQMVLAWRKPLIIFTPKQFLRSPLMQSPVTAFVTPLEPANEDPAPPAKRKRKTNAAAPAATGLATLGPDHRPALAPVLGDPWAERDPRSVVRAVLVSGKFFFELSTARARRYGLSPRQLEPAAQADVAADADAAWPPVDTALIRIETLAPFPWADLGRAIAQFPRLTQLVWAQEEPENQGPWPWVMARLLSAPLEPGLPHRLRTVALVARPPSAAVVTGRAAIYTAQQAELIAAALDSHTHGLPEFPLPPPRSRS